MSFSTAGLSDTLARAAQALGFAEPTSVQAQAIPAVLGGTDVLAQAPTGSGKTAAYALPLLQRQQATRQRYPAEAPLRLRILVLVPTRELAIQAAALMRDIARHLPLPARVALAHGGVSANPQMMALRGGADVLVATPGRLLDLVDQRAVRLDAVETLVLDEADRLLDLGFADELQRVLALLPPQRQNLLFSATFPPAVEALASAGLRAPVHLAVEAANDDAPAIVQRAIAVDPVRRTELLRHLVAEHDGQRMLVFVATQYAAGHVAWKLYKNGVFATPFHGGLAQGARNQVLAEFKNGQWDVLVTTDLAARGIDIAQLPIVVNYDLPRSAVDYVHRIGRTGRAGESGTAISFVSPSTEAHFRLIEKRQGQTIAREQVAGFEPTEAVEEPPIPSSESPNGTGGVKGKRPSKKDKLRAAARSAQGDTPAAPLPAGALQHGDVSDSGTAAAEPAENSHDGGNGSDGSDSETDEGGGGAAQPLPTARPPRTGD